MKDTKRRMEYFMFYDYTNIVRHLEKMAERGWLLEGRNNFIWKYRRIEPQKLHFAVTYFPQASEFDAEPSENQKTFQEFCAMAGWKHVVSAAQMQIFVNEAEHPIPIETDAMTQVENIHKAMKKNYLLANFALLAVILLNAIMFLYRLAKDPIIVLGSDASLFNGVSWCLLILVSMIEIISYFRWYYKAKKIAEQDGGFIETKGYYKSQAVVLLIMGISWCWWIFSNITSKNIVIEVVALVGTIIIIYLVDLVKNIFKKRKASTNMTRTATIIACILLSVIVTVGISYGVFHLVRSGWFREETKELQGDVYFDSMFLSQVGSREEDIQYVSYKITTIKIPEIYDWCLNSILKKEKSWEEQLGLHYIEDDAMIWNADAAYRLYSGGDILREYLVCWENKIVEVRFYEEPTEERIKIVADKLNN